MADQATTWRVLGLVPARGGSKGVPRKNIKLLGGRPLLAYTLEAAESARRLSDVVVSTDDDEIEAAAQALGAGTLRRPPELAGDMVPMAPVVQHALAEIERVRGVRYDAVATLQVTSPFRTAEDIDLAVDLLETSRAESVISVVRIYDDHPARVKRIFEDRLHDYCVPEDEASRRQDLPPAYLRNGAIYLTRRDVVLGGSLRGTDQCPYEMPAERSVNIDGIMDFFLAEAVLRHRAQE